MKLIDATVNVYKSIEDSGKVPIDERVTILVGQNESGKTAFLQALHKAFSVEDSVGYNVTEDYPRKQLNAYEAKHEDNPAIVCKLKYKLDSYEIEEINNDLGINLIQEFEFEKHYKYGGSSTIIMNVPEQPYIKHLVSQESLSSDIKKAIEETKSVKSMIETLEALDLNNEEDQFLEKLKAKFKSPSKWSDLLDYYVWKKFINPKTPKFLYFDDYRLLPGKINLPQLLQRVRASENDPQVLKEEDKTALSLLKMARVDLEDLTQASGYEKVKAKLEAISNSITDKVFDYWKQNQELDVEFDIRADPTDEAPFNAGNNLYIRIRNRRHRVTVPFSQRSKGFIWFFSFIVWFDSIKEQLETDRDIILLLDEPGLSLHALAQEDFLDYIENLADDHQIIYSTHSPFMVPSDQLHRVRMVEDKIKEGTKITSNISSSDPKTVFPLQAALGYSIAQNLFISKKNLLVEGPADLIYLKFFSSFLESKGRKFLDPDITIIPVGGLDKLATFIALLGGNQLEVAVLHDYNHRPDARLETLSREKLINKRQIYHYGMFRDETQSGKKDASQYLNSDVEDMLSPRVYLTLFNSAYQNELNGINIKVSDLPQSSDRIVERINSYLKSNSIRLRPSGGFNHYLPANHLATKSLTPSKIDDKTLLRFEALFKRVNNLF